MPSHKLISSKIAESSRICKINMSVVEYLLLVFELFKRTPSFLNKILIIFEFILLSTL